MTNWVRDDFNNPMHPRLDLMDEQQLIEEGNRRQAFWLHLGARANDEDGRQRVTDLTDWVFEPRRALENRRGTARFADWGNA